MEAEALPEHQVALAIDPDVTVAIGEGERIIEVLARAFHEPGGDRHSPVSAPTAQVSDRRPLRRLAVRAEIGAEGIASVEELGQHRKLNSFALCGAEQLVSPLHVAGDVERIGGHLDGSYDDLHGRTL